ncbi:OmpA family protein [Spirosoma pollinicola]|uniref:OmpA-like domain-containing protein n=1 Tax=Spirosoma pollinicola TaxID=2057025 RepID=A0A2K8Z399_9BACT|nr:OmpA family protein [Spirosoma pollinicola]AUD04353.1 hypothetical protein CWM47_22415 [Spirosoma pollinicola]
MLFLTVDHPLTGLLKALTLAIRPKRVQRLIGFLLALSTCTQAQVVAQEPSGKAMMLPVSITILYFDQSSPMLRPRVKTTLDSLARLLINQPTLSATLTGYTDDVGKRELNLILAEKRTKAVAMYLTQRGVPADQIIARWEGPDKDALADDPKAVKTIGRRVAVQLLPR